MEETLINRTMPNSREAEQSVIGLALKIIRNLFAIALVSSDKL